MGDTIKPFRLRIPEQALDDLRDRLRRTRWPERETAPGWEQGVPLAAAQDLCVYWLDRYDWRRCEDMLNGLGQFRTTIEDLSIHFLHVRSPEPGALPLVMTHGWPGSVIEFHKVLGPLTDPRAHGGDARDAFHVVVPSLPGYGFSERPGAAGWSVERIAGAWITLMRQLGYRRFVAQGGDWGSAVTTAMARAGAPELAAVHLGMVLARPGPEDLGALSPAEQAAWADMERYRRQGNGYAVQQATRPQTLGYGLTDSPAGLAAWIFEKFREWTDSNGDPLNVLSYDEILDNVMLYWLPATPASAARLYWESFRGLTAQPIDIPVGCSVFPGEIFRPSRRWAERLYPRLIHWGEPARGGHFAAFEQPELFVEEVRSAFRSVRSA